MNFDWCKDPRDTRTSFVFHVFVLIIVQSCQYEVFIGTPCVDHGRHSGILVHVKVKVEVRERNKRI
jgi:hypothetical protein